MEEQRKMEYDFFEQYWGLGIEVHGVAQVF
jgi:hypothetical protein